MAEQWTEEKISAMPSDKRRKLYDNAKSHGSEKGDALAKSIEEVGLSNPLQSGIDMDDPLVFRIHEIINSPGGKEAAVRAAKDGLPALAGVDPLLATDLGRDYGKHNQTTHTAGSLVAILMRELGYRDTNRAALRKAPGPEQPENLAEGIVAGRLLFQEPRNLFAPRAALGGKGDVTLFPMDKPKSPMMSPSIPANIQARSVRRAASERDYQELKQEVGLGDHEGRSWRGFHHHGALCIAAYGFLVAEKAALPPSAPETVWLVKAPALPDGYRPRGGADPDRTPYTQLNHHPAAADRPGARGETTPMSMPYQDHRAST